MKGARTAKVYRHMKTSSFIRTFDNTLLPPLILRIQQRQAGGSSIDLKAIFEAH